MPRIPSKSPSASWASPKAAEQQVSPDVEQVFGRLPRTFTEWAVRNAAPFE
ncbi:hypothetical protein [Saccharopolyspora pogona]|uniref:hypothetical protein n=1 Tax=Saccharopolyspora pogona TaxID=333966 RepID=UPI0037CA23B2